MNFNYLTRRELMAILKALSALPVLNACEKIVGDSDTKDLTNSTSLTEISKTRVDFAIQKFGMEQWVKYPAGAGRQDVFDNLATVPDIYLAFLQERARTVGFTVEGGGQAAGMCWFDGVGATKITLNSPSFATIHEVGHGVESYSYKLQNKDGVNLRERTYSAIMDPSRPEAAEASSIRAYAKSNSKELFADGFSSFYRSPKSRADLANMPFTFKWLKSVLVCPVNLGPNEDPEDYIPSNSEHMTKPSGTATANAQNAMTVDNTTLDDKIVTPGVSSAGTVESGNAPVGSPQTATPVASGSNPCASPADQLTALMCQLSSNIGGTSGSGLTLTEDAAEVLMPLANQFLTAHDRFLFMARLAVSNSEAERVRIYLDKTLLTTGVEKDRYAGRSDIYSVMFKIPTAMTPTDQLQYRDRTFSVVLDGKTIAEVPVRVSRYSLCGDISDFKSRS
jgi:hypothetical protein